MGTSRFEITELAQLVRGSAATFRMLVVDACQSGSLTRKKGGRIGAPFELPDDITGEGLALLTASTADEDAQESDQLGASFFTHALLSGLLGAADRDRDGNVVLEEAYRYAYENTLRNTSRTTLGPQHPTFSYDLRGQGQLVLTRPGHALSARGLLELPTGASYLVLKLGAQGPVVAEIALGDTARSLSLEEGRYFVRGRSERHLLEGTVSVRAGERTRVDKRALTRVEYAQLARKGTTLRRHAHGLELGGRVRTTLPNAATPCAGVFTGYRLDGTLGALSARFGYCTSTTEQPLIETRTNEYDLTVRAAWVSDLSSRIALDLGLGAGLVYFTQHYETRGRAEPRHSLSGERELFAALSVDVARSVYLTLDVAGQVYVLRLEEKHSEGLARASLAGRAGLGMGKRF